VDDQSDGLVLGSPKHILIADKTLRTRTTKMGPSGFSHPLPDESSNDLLAMGFDGVPLSS